MTRTTRNASIPATYWEARSTTTLENVRAALVDLGSPVEMPEYWTTMDVRMKEMHDEALRFCYREHDRLIAS